MHFCLSHMKVIFNKIHARSLGMRFGVAFLFAMIVGACSSTKSTSDAGPDAGIDLGDNFDLPIEGATADQITLFNKGDELFSLVFRDYDGLGPLYIRQSCASCHD